MLLNIRQEEKGVLKKPMIHYEYLFAVASDSYTSAETFVNVLFSFSRVGINHHIVVRIREKPLNFFFQERYACFQRGVNISVENRTERHMKV